MFSNRSKLESAVSFSSLSSTATASTIGIRRGRHPSALEQQQQQQQQFGLSSDEQQQQQQKVLENERMLHNSHDINNNSDTVDTCISDTTDTYTAAAETSSNLNFMDRLASLCYEDDGAGDDDEFCCNEVNDNNTYSNNNDDSNDEISLTEHSSLTYGITSASSNYPKCAAEDSHQPTTLEGTLHVRKGGRRGAATALVSPSCFLWKKRYVFLNFLDGGSITIYQDANPAAAATLKPNNSNNNNPSTLQTVYSKLNRFTSMNFSLSRSKVHLHLPAHFPWIVKDVENDSSSFVIELPFEALDDILLQHANAFPPPDNNNNNDGGTYDNVTTSPASDSQSSLALEDLANFADDTLMGDRHLHDESCLMQHNEPTTEAETTQEEVVGHSLLTMSSHHNNNNSLSIERPMPLGEWGEALVLHSKATEQPLRVYFFCSKGSHEKALWLKAFSRLDRLSLEMRRQQRRKQPPTTRLLQPLLHKLTALQPKLERRRKLSHETFCRDARQLDLVDDAASVVVVAKRRNNNNNNMTNTSGITTITPTTDCCSDLTAVLSTATTPAQAIRCPPTDVEQLVRGETIIENDHNNLNSSNHANPSSGGCIKNEKKEYKVQPTYAYPHRWMTQRELSEELILPSETFHDLRVSSSATNTSSDSRPKEIGFLRVEVLQCFGLPKLDRTSDTDAVVYMVCGSYAFTTDVIPNKNNPMWLRKSRRACEFPLFHAYARLYVGVFDDDPNRVKDEFAGRVVIDLARLRPRSTYDVTLPLRLSTHVYSRRRRGAVRLRFTHFWNSERDALMSYLPKKIKITPPQHSKPNLDVTVMCADEKAFRNIAVTVHGAHLPGKFAFQQMRATIREINFTRKYILTAIRQWMVATRQWQSPFMSCCVFCSWMHCIYVNSFALVPAYMVSYLVLQLFKNYAYFGMDGPNQRGFVPPSWEEMLCALLAVKKDNKKRDAIEPLDLSRSNTTIGSSSSSSYKVKTHEPLGKSFFRGIGFLKEYDVEETHLEFPFANGKDYPKFTVKDCLVPRKGEQLQQQQQQQEQKQVAAVTTSSSSSSGKRGEKLNASTNYDNGDTTQNGQDALHLSRTGNGETRMMPRFMLDHVVDIQDIMRKDSSGLKEFDEEEDNFATSRAVVRSGKKAVTRTALTITKTATEINERTGLHHVVNPIANHVVTPITSSITSGISCGVSSVAHVMDEVAGYATGHRRSASRDAGLSPLLQNNNSQRQLQYNFNESESCSILDGSYDLGSSTFNSTKVEGSTTLSEANGDKNSGAEDLSVKLPEQNVDVAGPNTGKKMTDDLAEVKDKMHDLTWHCFDDKLYTVKHPDALYFGQAKKTEKQRKKTGAAKGIEKLMKVGQYSHTNPFVARVGLYVEPMIGSAYSFLCLFRAGFNVWTWRDPMLTFWFSLFSVLLAIILFVFPWRLFLFLLGGFLVGPQNWLIRVAREMGYLRPLPKRVVKKVDKTPEMQTELPKDQPVFTYNHRQQGNKFPKEPEIDPREVHHVVVPYGPFMHQRFYDWPPEPQYASVTSVVGCESSSAKRQPNHHLHLSATAAGMKPFGRFPFAARKQQHVILQHAKPPIAAAECTPFQKRFHRLRGRSYSADETSSLGTTTTAKSATPVGAETTTTIGEAAATTGAVEQSRMFRISNRGRTQSADYVRSKLSQSTTSIAEIGEEEEEQD